VAVFALVLDLSSRVHVPDLCGHGVNRSLQTHSLVGPSLDPSNGGVNGIAN